MSFRSRVYSHLNLTMFYNLTKELEKRGILRSDPRLTPVTTILKNIFLERLDRSKVTVNIRIARPRNALWRAILRQAILSTSFIRIARPIYYVFLC